MVGGTPRPVPLAVSRFGAGWHFDTTFDTNLREHRGTTGNKLTGRVQSTKRSRDSGKQWQRHSFGLRNRCSTTELRWLVRMGWQAIPATIPVLAVESQEVV